jgi:hypothetical protein
MLKPVRLPDLKCLVKIEVRLITDNNGNNSLLRYARPQTFDKYVITRKFLSNMALFC